METKHLYFAFDVKAEGDSGVIEGYGSIFGNVDQGGDIVAPGAFAESLKEWKASGGMPAMLWQHDPSQPIGVWDEMTEDEKGLKVKGRFILETQQGREAYALVKAGALKGLSIGYRVKEYSYDREKDVRTLLGVKLWEVSPVTFPMNQAAGITVAKSATEIHTIREFESFLRDAGFSKADAKALASHGWQGLKRRDAESDDAKQAEVVAMLRGLLDKLKPE